MFRRANLRANQMFNLAKRCLITRGRKDRKLGRLMIERDDHLIYEDPEDYIYRGPSSVYAYESRLLEQVKSPILDLGCGPGRIAISLGRSGHTVVGIDNSEDALITLQKSAGTDHIAIARMSINQLGFAPESFSTIVAMGYNIGAAGNLANLRVLFSQLRRCCIPGGFFFLTSVDVMKRWDYESYFLANVMKGRDRGQSRRRLRRGSEVGEWSDWIYVNPNDLRMIARQTGWKVSEIAYDDEDPQSYAAVLENTP